MRGVNTAIEILPVLSCLSYAVYMKPENSIPTISGKALDPIIQRNVVNFLDPKARKNRLARTQHCTPKLKKISTFVGTICKSVNSDREIPRA